MKKILIAVLVSMFALAGVAHAGGALTSESDLYNPGPPANKDKFNIEFEYDMDMNTPSDKARVDVSDVVITWESDLLE